MHNLNKLRILYWNSQSLHHKSLEVFDYLSHNNIDLALFSETWLKPNRNLSHPQYILYRSDRVEQEHGGVAIAIGAGLTHTLLPSFNTQIIESIGVSINTQQGNIKLISVYFPSTQQIAANLQSFRKDISKLTQIRSSYFICGDLNSKHRFWNCVRGNAAGNILYKEMTNRNFNIHHPPTPTNHPRQANAIP